MRKQLNLNETATQFALPKFINQRINHLGIQSYVSVTSEPIRLNWFKRLLSIDRENITVSFNLPYSENTKVVSEMQQNIIAIQSIDRLCDDILNYIDDIKRTLT